MSGMALPPGLRAAGNFRDATSKNCGAFVCAGTHNSVLCNKDHTSRRQGVGRGRMRSACQTGRLRGVNLSLPKGRDL